MKSDTTSFSPSETATPPNPSKPQTAENVTPSESKSYTKHKLLSSIARTRTRIGKINAPRNTINIGTPSADRAALVPVTSLGSRLRASVPPTASMAARSCDRARRVAASMIIHADAV